MTKPLSKKQIKEIRHLIDVTQRLATWALAWLS